MCLLPISSSNFERSFVRFSYLEGNCVRGVRAVFNLLSYKYLISVNMNNAISRCIPYFTSGVVIKGFGRGSKELGIPTANFPEDVVDRLPHGLSCGVYYGWAQIGNCQDVYKMVMSIGWNPFYKNEKKSMETHVLHHFDTDFYGELMRIAILGYIRPERSFNSKEELIDAINEDIAIAKAALDLSKHALIAEHPIFNNVSSPIHNGKL